MTKPQLPVTVFVSPRWVTLMVQYLMAGAKVTRSADGTRWSARYDQ